MLFILEDNDERIAAFSKAIGGRPHHVERTVPESITWLLQYKNEVTLYSLDNDLIVPDYDGEEGEGWQLCEWILTHAVKAPIICHTQTLMPVRRWNLPVRMWAGRFTVSCRTMVSTG